MDSSLYAEIKNVYGIDLSDYYVEKNSYNPLVYIHKKYVSKNDTEPCLDGRSTNQNINDKCQQFDYDRLHTDTHKTKVITSGYKDPLVDQTIKFAKDIIPITIPPSTNLANPCTYTVKSFKKIKREHEPQEHTSNLKSPIDATFDREKSKLTLNLKHRKCKKNKDSSTTSASHFSDNNTIDDINENQSLSYSLSELSEQPKKEVFVEKNNKNNVQNPKLVASESFEAIAAEYMNTSAESKIKIHLMNEKDKLLFCENIRSPVLKAIKECFHEINNQNDLNTELQNVNKIIQCHAKKIDNILEKLACIDNKLDMLAKPKESPKIEVIKASKLEEFGQDVGAFKEESSEEELACVNFSSKSRSKNTLVSPMYNEKDVERDYQSVDDLARGENVPEYFKPATSRLGIMPERSNRIPARFCWTDTVMK